MLRSAVLLTIAAGLAADDGTRWSEFIGRFHIVTLHLPIGLLVALAVVEARSWWRGQLQPDPVRAPLGLATAVAALFTVVCGLLLANSGDYDPDQVGLHQWLGIATGVACVALVALDWWQRRRPAAGRWYRLGLGAGLILVTLAGHFGGDLTHGRGFLTRHAPPWLGGRPPIPAPGAPAPTAPSTEAPAPAAPAPVDPPPAQPAIMAPAAPAAPPAPPMMDEPAMDEPPEATAMMSVAPTAEAPPAPSGVSFSRQIVPILSERCYSCHGADKQKGNLRLDSPAAIRSGGKNGVVVLAGQPDKSLLYTTLVLPEDHDDFMPAKGGPLKPEQIALIQAWIAAGAVFDEAAPAAAPTPAAPTSATGTVTGYDQLAATLGAPDARVVASLTAAGAVVRSLSRDGKALEINCSHTKAPVDERLLQQIGKLGANVLWLDLAGTAVTADQLAVLRTLPNLQRLHLERTRLDDAAFVHLLPLAKLEYLNLVGTQVSDAGLYRIKGLANLRRLYLWQSKVTKAGAERIAADLPGCTVSNGP